MASMNGYDATNGDMMGGNDALPAGEYIAVIVKSERRESKKNPGNAYLNLEFEVTDGPCSGRHFFTMVNIWNTNQQAAEIAQREMNTICHAVGRLRINDSEELHGIPMRVKLSVDDNPQYGIQNRVKGYKPLNGTAAAASAPAQQQSSAGASSSAPWKRSA